MPKGAKRLRHDGLGAWHPGSSRLCLQRLSGARRERGFTLLELMIVISMILILMSIAVPMYTQSVVRARESVLRQDLFTLRSVISQYTLDKAKAPQGLEDLKTAGYIREIPKDPMTKNPEWGLRSMQDDPDSDSWGGQSVFDVYSKSQGDALDGTKYKDW